MSATNLRDLIGQRVHYWSQAIHSGQPVHGVIVYAHSETCVDLTVSWPSGSNGHLTSVKIIRPGQVAEGSHCTFPNETAINEVHEAVKRGFTGK